MTKSDTEKNSREAHIEKLEADIDIEHQKTVERTGIDREVEQELQSVKPSSDAPSRAGITSDGSGADGQRG